LTFQQRSREELEGRVRERTKALETELAEHAGAREHIERLLGRLVTAQEDERARIARDLHDELGQQLTTLRLAIEQHQSSCPVKPAERKELDRALEVTRSLDSEVDFLAWELRPAALDDLGLKVALPRFVKEWAAHHRLEAECRTIVFDSGHLTREAELVFYRIAQESLNNTVKHAHASRIDVIIETRDGTVILVVEDNGIGFDAAKLPEKGIGFAGMRERALLVGASLQVESEPGKGTTIFLRCPVQPTEAP
jgi:signal transduction histidine kinase